MIANHSPQGCPDNERLNMAEQNLENNENSKLSASLTGPDDDKQVDMAMKSLSDALQVSFRLLSFIMVLFVILFLATGIEFIQPQEQGIVKVFGQVTRVAKNGLVYNWPFPIGEIQKVSTQERRLTVENFWLFETPDQRVTPLAQRRRSPDGLRPGWDGYLLTGDRNLIHLKFVCAYRVQNPLALTSNIENLDKMMEMVLCNAAVYSASTRTADAIQIDHTGFLNEVQEVAQAQIDALLGLKPDEPHAVVINNVLLPQGDSKTWPLGAYSAYEQAQRAKSEKQTVINKAIAEAKQTLIGAVGAKHYSEFVGNPWENAAIQRQNTLAGTVDNEKYNLIGQLGIAEDRNAMSYASNDEEAEQIKKIIAEKEDIRREIDQILTTTTLGGEASSIIAEAESEKTRTIQNAQRRAKRFVDLLAQYRKTPKLFLEKMWADAIDDAFSRETNQKHYFLPGAETYVLYMNTDPKITQQIRNYERKLKNADEKK